MDGVTVCPGKRLSAIASFVPKGVILADIGTDHAYLPLYLAREKACPFIIAVEKSQRNCERARQVVSLHGLGQKIHVRCADGLSALREKDGVEVIVIAGLGGKTICQLLMQSGHSLKRYRRFVLQPMGDAPLLRRWLVSRGFAIREERLVKEKGHFYEIIVAEPGRMTVVDPFHYELGPLLVASDDPLLVPWLEKKLAQCKGILKALEKKVNGKDLRRRYYERRLNKLKEVLLDVRHRQ